MKIRAQFPHLPENLDLAAFLGKDVSLDDSVATIDRQQTQALASLDRMFEYQRRLETRVRILERQQQPGRLVADTP